MSSPEGPKAPSEETDELGDVNPIILVDHGDLRIRVHRSREKRSRLRVPSVTPFHQRILIVSSAVMRIASPVWRTMFDPQGHFMESQRSSSPREIHFPDDDADALLIVLYIAHLQFGKLPEALDYQELLNLAIICDKYDTVSTVRPVSDFCISSRPSLHSTKSLILH